jgi:CrcB protein
MQLLLLASAGGAIGAGLRYLVNEAFDARGMLAFPWATLTVNVIGCLLMGMLVGMFAERSHIGPELRTFLTTGILGGFTTFSAFSMDFVRLIENGEGAPAFVYVAASVLLSIGAVFLGLWIARTVIA